METTIKLTKQQKDSLVAFLQRVQLTGAEVPFYVELVAAINKPFLDTLKENKEVTK